ncbi:hypothetical protein ROS1_30920 [Roseibium sp. ROS1]
MGIEVAQSKAVRINDLHEKGVDTSVEANPTRGSLDGIPVIHAFKRNQRGNRRDDGNPLIYALKGRNGYSITPFWKTQIMRRAKQILEKVQSDLQGFDLCLAIPSSSSFCNEFSSLVAGIAQVDILASDFLRKKNIGEILEDFRGGDRKVRPGQKKPLQTLIDALEKDDQNTVFQAKKVNTRIRTLFDAFTTCGECPDVTGKRILIVDDIISTGSSVQSIRRILCNELGAEMACVSFLSDV